MCIGTIFRMAGISEKIHPTSNPGLATVTPKTSSISPANNSILCLVAALLLLAACDVDDEENRPIGPAKPFSEVMSDTAKGTVQCAADIIKEPFQDIGLSKDDIPQVLRNLSENPYVMPAAPLCENLGYEIVALNKVLGADMGTPSSGEKRSYTEEGLEAAQGKAGDMMRGEVQVIPFRGVVRRISGAEKHARKVAAAYEAGKLRRAFLKGLSRAYHCNND